MVAPERVLVVVEPVLGEFGMEVVDVEASRDGLRVVVDRPGGVDLDALAEATQVVSGALDDKEVAGPRGSYTLEVSSPGVERVLRTPEHFGRFVGTMVAVKTLPGTPGERRVQGRLVEAGDEAILLESPGDGDRRQVSYADIERARTVLDWGPAARPGRGEHRRGGGWSITSGLGRTPDSGDRVACCQTRSPLSGRSPTVDVR